MVKASSTSASVSWVPALNAMQEAYALSADGIGVFAINLRFNLDDVQAIAAEAITGGGDDKKCDIIYIDREREVAVVAQCYISSKDRPAAPANKASDLNTAMSWLLATDINDLPTGLQGRSEELRSAIREGDVKQLHVWYVHNLPESDNVAKELKTVEATTKKLLHSLDPSNEVNIFASELGSTELERLYQLSERTVIVTDEFQTSVPDAIEIGGDTWTSLVTTVSGTWLHGLYKTYGRDLFSANLRGYLGSRDTDSNINNGIKNSAQHAADNFYVYNNGLTALVLSYEISTRRRGSQRRLKIQGLSIVNGAQTTGSLGSLDAPLDEKLRVPVRFIKSDNDQLIADIVRFNNSQNKIQAADFRSTDSIQDRLRREFEAIPDAEYEGGRRGGASDAIKRSKYSLPSYTVGQALASFHGEPVIAYNKKSDIWTSERVYRQIFTDRTSAKHIVFCYSLLEAVNARKLHLIAKQREDPDSLTEQESKQLGFLNRKGATFLLVHVISRSVETVLNRKVANRFDLQFKGNLSPAKGAELWSPILQVFLSLSNQLDSAFTRERISQETVDQTVPLFTGLIESLASVHETTFKPFAAKVIVSTA